MPIHTMQSRRLEKLRKETEELEKLMTQGGTDDVPTQSPDSKKPESSENLLEGTAGQDGDVKPQEPAKDLEHYKERCHVAESRYNVTKAKLDSNIHKLKQENLRLQKDSIELRKALNQANQAAPGKKSFDVENMFNQEVIDVLGQTTVDAMKKAFEDTNARVDKSEAKSQDDEITAAENKLTAEANAVYDKFMSNLRGFAPNVDKLNKDEKFLNWLGLPDEKTGMIRFDALQEQEAIKNAFNVAQFFIEYEATLGVKKKDAPKDSVNKHRGPDSSNAGSDDNNSSDSEGWITRAYITEFSRKVGKGEYRGKYSEQKKIEAKIDKAYMEGKVR